jgi:polyisoprenoid-binding protein YceI
MKTIGICIFIISVVVSAAGLEARELHVDRSQPNMVRFISDAKIEQFEGVTSQIDGYLYWEGQDMTENSTMYFEVDLNSIDTGIGLRNRHMRENYLHTDQYPYTKYTGKISESTSINGNSWQVKTEGRIFIHGVEKPLSVTAEISLTADHLYHVVTEFEVSLSDFDIEIPSIMFLKIDENMKLKLDFFMSEPSK